MSKDMRIRLDRTICDGFGACAKHAPGYFSLDELAEVKVHGLGIERDLYFRPVKFRELRD